MRRARDLLAEASVLAEAPGSSYVASGSRQYDSQPPSGQAGSLYLAMLRVYETMSDEEFVDWAERQLRQAKRARRKPTTVEEKRYWIARAPSTVPTRELAQRYGLSERTVQDIRHRAGSSPRRGRPRQAVR